MTYSLGLRIEKARDTKGYSQKFMANQLEITPSAWSLYESDNREPTLSHFRKIVELLDVSADWLLGLTDDELRHREGSRYV